MIYSFLFPILFQLVFSQFIQNNFQDSPHNFYSKNNTNNLENCRACHISKNNSIDSTLELNSNNLCLNCHNGKLANFFPSSDINDSKVELEKFSHHYNINKENKIKCTECHDPHNNSNGNFLRKKKEHVCLDCHNDLNINLSVHKNPLISSLSQNNNLSCESCHNIHLISSHKSFLKKDENQLCIDCHDGIKNNPNENPSYDNINKVINKLYTHITLNNSEIHTSIQSINCSDCHNPHLATEKNIGMIDGSLHGVKGKTSWGTTINSSIHEYEICYKCHSYSNMHKTNNIAQLFKPSNTSYHPVEQLSNNINALKSLKPNLNSMTLITCSDCHGNDNKFGIKGPHGSNNKGILKLNYENTEFTVKSTQLDNELCFQCHKEKYITESVGFRWHKLHIDSGYNCSACHDSHGSKDYPTLLNFDKDYIRPLNNGQFEFNKSSQLNGTCTLSCHGHVHDNINY
jgi:predicted CXXCH cytochrome family protein